MRWRFCVCFWLNRFTSDGFSSTCLNAYEDLGGLITGGGGLGGLHLLEQLVEDVDERVVVGGAEDLRHERASLVHELHRQAQRVQHQ